MEKSAISEGLACIHDLCPISRSADAMFSVRLLDTYPDVYRLFALDIEPRDRRLMHVLGLVVAHVRDFGAVSPTVTALARSHAVFRLIETHYEAIAETLIWTLRRSLGEKFTIEAERAWLSALWRAKRADVLGASKDTERSRKSAGVTATSMAQSAGWSQIDRQ
ncbi:globin domain-containing protein [Methylocystis echinoides]|uniref:Globin domain-containing protein n=1 Tax=Methylocystis echinoides TaxID=29468 RepID=A0A9W6GWK1_9HYPH|nr:globin domain-containing protein [Methylocystis echinoides]GLI94261.1 hypothetical protein LMG27198_32530 [Methylocystis echinoides]